VAGPCERGNEPSGFINAGNFLTVCGSVVIFRRIQLFAVKYLDPSPV
jgi:hypothetical protein